MTADQARELELMKVVAIMAERDRFRAERDRARVLAAKLIDEDRSRGFGLVGTLASHHRDACQGRGCAIHHPSDHHMRDWPRNWRPDRGFMERTCAHGVGHPDPDDAVFRASRGDTDTLHGCCPEGCCTPR